MKRKIFNLIKITYHPRRDLNPQSFPPEGNAIPLGHSGIVDSYILDKII